MQSCLFTRQSGPLRRFPQAKQLQLQRQLRGLSVQSNNHSDYLQKLSTIWRELETLGVTVDDLMHYLFIIGLGEHQKKFVRTKLDTFFQEGCGEIRNMDLRQFQDETEGCERE